MVPGWRAGARSGSGGWSTRLRGRRSYGQGRNLTEAYASLRTWCVRNGHGLGQKEHEAGGWVAATGVWLQVRLVAHDAIFANVKDLELLTRSTVNKMAEPLVCH